MSMEERGVLILVICLRMNYSVVFYVFIPTYLNYR